MNVENSEYARPLALAGSLLVLVLLTGLTGCNSTGGNSADAFESGDATGDGAVVRMGNLVVRNVPEIPETVSERLRQYQNTRSAGLRGWIGDGLIIATRFGETTQLHRVRTPGGAREQITFFDEPVVRAYVPPAGNETGILFARDTGGSEFYQLFWQDWATGQARMLTDGKSRYGSVVFSRDGQRFAYATTQRNGRNWDIHLQELNQGGAGEGSVALESESGSWWPADFSADGQRLLVGQYISINESYAYELNLADGSRRAILDESLQTAIGDVLYSGDGKGVYFTSDVGAEFMRLHYLDLASGEIRVLTPDVPWNVEGFTLSDDGRRLAMSINENGISRITVWRLPDHRPLALPEIPAGVVSRIRFSSDSSQVAFSLSPSTSPTDVFSIDLSDRNLTRWTRSEVGGLDTDTFSAPELIEYPTFDDANGGKRRIPAFVYRPEGPGPHPVLIAIHGGPESQYRPGFSSTYQYLINELGITVIAPNVRGSSGYGKSYLKLDNARLREDSVKDIGALLDWIGTQPDLDPSRVAVMGGSYGGYMVLASLVHYSDRLAAGVERYGISNYVTFLTNTQPYRQDMRRAEYGDERDPGMRAFLESISPLNRVGDITRPLLISQGFNDPRVPASESEQIVAALEKADVPVWYVLAMDEGHGFRKKANRDYNSAATVVFLEQYLLPERR